MPLAKIETELASVKPKGTPQPHFDITYIIIYGIAYKDYFNRRYEQQPIIFENTPTGDPRAP
jgi:hypothetical protein